MEKIRVVITGMGVVAPNAVGLEAFEEAIRKGRPGIRHIPELEELNFACQVAGIPQISEAHKKACLTPLLQKDLRGSGILYGIIAAKDAWADAGLPDHSGSPDWDTGCVFGSGMAGIERLREGIYLVDEGKVKRLGSTLIEQTMESGISAHLSGLLGLGNQVTSNSSACSTGTEALIMAYERIALGKARRMLAGSCNSHGPHTWGGFDSMRVLNRQSNDQPEAASRPMSATASGFVPGSGAGALLLESLDSAVERGARIYAEIRGAAINSGGQRQGGTMTAPNPAGVVRCITMALRDAGVQRGEIDAISGHLTATKGDVLEVENWSEALRRRGADFPYINSLKSMIGHCLGAAGAIECVAAVLQLHKGFLHPSTNCEDLHPDIAVRIDPACIPSSTLELPEIKTIAKSSFGFGDVNACVVFAKYH